MGYAGPAYLRALLDVGELLSAAAAGSGPQVNFPVEVETTGAYAVWVRAMATGSGGDSLHVGLDGQVAETSANLTGFVPDEWSWSRLTLDSGNATLDLNSSGDHTIGLFMREDGIRVDRLLLITDTNYIPTGLGPEESQQTVITPSTNLSDVTSITYEYDPLYRLTGAVYTVAITATYVYTYDAVGNMSEYVETIAEDTSSVNRTFNPANQLITATNGISTTSYLYDDNGNLVEIDGAGTNGDLRYGFNQRNMLITNTNYVDGTGWVLQAEYGYDGSNDRLQQIAYGGGVPVTTTYTNDIIGLAQVLVSDNGVTQTHMLFGLDLILQDDGQMRFLLADGLGSTRLEMVGSQVETTTTYEPYGKLLAQTGPSGTVYGYTGEAHDASTGLLFLRARYYSPDLKLFLSRDPFPGYTTLSISQNGYAYVHANPVNLTDPTGETAWPNKNIEAIQVLKPVIIDSAERHNDFARSNLTDEAFAALMAAHLNRESRLGVLTKRYLWDIAGDFAARLGLNTSIGIANIRPGVGAQILFGVNPGIPGCFEYNVEGSEILDLWNTLPEGSHNYPYGESKEDVIQAFIVNELFDDELSIEYLAANIERGFDRADYFGIEPSVFNLGNWIWSGEMQADIMVKEWNDNGTDKFRHGANLVLDMPKAFEVLDLPITYYNAYNSDEAELIELCESLGEC
jgi:RHS repeat-associated protein